MAEEAMKFRLELFDKLYNEFLRLRERYGDDSLDKMAIGINCAVDYILDNYDLTPKTEADGEPRRPK